MRALHTHPVVVVGGPGVVSDLDSNPQNLARNPIVFVCVCVFLFFLLLLISIHYRGWIRENELFQPHHAHLNQSWRELIALYYY